MAVARIDSNNNVLEIRKYLNYDDIPVHKKYMWLPVNDQTVTVNTQIEEIKDITPFVNANTNMVEYDYVIVPKVITQVTAYQAKMVLIQSNLYANVVTAIESANDISLTVAWETATIFERNSQFILNMQPVLGLSNTEIDNLFVQASLIQD